MLSDSYVLFAVVILSHTNCHHPIYDVHVRKHKLTKNPLYLGIDMTDYDRTSLAKTEVWTHSNTLKQEVEWCGMKNGSDSRKHAWNKIKLRRRWGR